MTIPVWLWAAAAAGLVAMVAAEVVLTGRPGHRSFTARRAIRWAAVYVSLAVVFGLAVGATAGWTAAGQFYGGYLTEYSLSLDNLFIFYVIMSWFAVPPARQQRVLLLGIGLALVLRSVLIVAGAAAIHRFGWLFYPMGAFLLWTAAGLIWRPLRQPAGGPAHPAEVMAAAPYAAGRRGSRQPPDRLAVRAAGGHPVAAAGRRDRAADVVFAFDSIPAVSASRPGPP